MKIISNSKNEKIIIKKKKKVNQTPLIKLGYYGELMLLKISDGGMKWSMESPGTLNITSSMVQISSIRVRLCCIESSPNRNTVAMERP